MNNRIEQTESSKQLAVEEYLQSIELTEAAPEVVAGGMYCGFVVNWDAKFAQAAFVAPHVQG